MREAAAQRSPPPSGDALFIPIAAGIRIGRPRRAGWADARALVRAMPNTPGARARRHHGPLRPGRRWAQTDRERGREAAGARWAPPLWFEHEGDLDAVTAVSGSGPAYVFYAIEALEQAARELGLAEGAARSLALWTFVGATKLAIERGEDPATLRAQVTSKGGTTEARHQGARGRGGEATTSSTAVEGGLRALARAGRRAGEGLDDHPGHRLRPRHALPPLHPGGAGALLDAGLPRARRATRSPSSPWRSPTSW